MRADRATMLANAARMRREPTEAERRLWQRLRASQLGGYKFRRQATIDGRIVDFLCPARALVVELDGETHDAAIDAERDADLLKRFGLVTVRFRNGDVMETMDGVLEHLMTILGELPDRWSGSTTPSPSSEEEGRL